MARGFSKKTQGFKGSTQHSAPGLKSAQPANSRINSLASVELICAGTVFLVALLLYSWTLAPTVTLTDSGELMVVARGLGIAHPPGVPLWTVLAHLASLVPLGSIAVRINFSSALFAALACAMLTLTVAELTITAPYLAPSKRRKRGAQSKKMDHSSVKPLVIAAPAIGAGLLMAFSRTLWSYATITEVYSLNTLLILIIFFLVLRWRRCIVADTMRVGAASHAGQVISQITTHDVYLYVAA